MLTRTLRSAILRRRVLSSPRCFSDTSHDDFKPKYHAATSSEPGDVIKLIQSHVETYPVMLYMKGTPTSPQCGFSRQVVQILHAQGVSFDSVNVLDHPEIREGIKEFSYVFCRYSSSNEMKGRPFDP
jgi:monothiol glutaredoxin